MCSNSGGEGCLNSNGWGDSTGDGDDDSRGGSNGDRNVDSSRCVCYIDSTSSSSREGGSVSLSAV